MSRRKPKPTFPTLPASGETALVCVEVEIIPLLAGVVRKFEQRDVWASAADHQRAYQWAAAFQEQLMNASCLRELIESNNRLYRLMDNALNGTVYSSDESTPPVVTPEIPAAPATPDGVTAGLRKQLLDMQGILPSGWPLGWGDQPATLAAIVRALRNDSQSQVDRVKNTFDALQRASQVASIFGAVSNFLEQGAEDVAEGGILATMIVSVMAQSAMMGSQAGQLDQLLAKLDRLIASLDGGQTPAPATNVISELEKANTLLG